jgi:hypothetical protein
MWVTVERGRILVLVLRDVGTFFRDLVPIFVRHDALELVDVLPASITAPSVVARHRQVEKRILAYIVTVVCQGPSVKVNTFLQEG